MAGLASLPCSIKKEGRVFKIKYRTCPDIQWLVMYTCSTMRQPAGYRQASLLKMQTQRRERSSKADNQVQVQIKTQPYKYTYTS